MRLKPLMQNHYFLFGHWVSVEPAADFAVLDAFGLRSVFDAALAALAEVTLVVRDCANADPAADFADFVADGLRSVLDADDAARLPVRSVFLAISKSPYRDTLFILRNREQRKNKLS